MPKKKKEKEEDLWMYILLQTTLLILLESIESYKFSISEIKISYIVLLLPLTIFITNYIIKKYNYKAAIISIITSGFATLLYIMIISFAINRPFILTNTIGEFITYIISQFTNLIIYSFILDNTKSPHTLVFLNYIFVLIIFYMIYTVFYLNLIMLDNYWERYFISITIQIIICIPLTIVDKLIKRGSEYDVNPK